MILIATNSNDYNESDEEVIDWLKFYKSDFKHFIGENFFEKGNPWSIEFKKEIIYSKINNDLVRSVWFRGFLSYRQYMKTKIKDLNSTNDNISELKMRTLNEVQKINNQLFDSFTNAYQLPKLNAIKVDKISMLRLANKLDFFGTKDVQIHLKSKISFSDLNKILIYFKESNVIRVELVFYNSTSTSFIKKSIKYFPKITTVYAFNQSKNEALLLESTNYLIKLTEKKLVQKLSINSMTPSLRTFMESFKHNIFYNRKIFINHRGMIVKSLLNKKEYGIFDMDTLKNLISNTEFTELWYVNRESIMDCKNCEYRYMCTSDTVPIYNNQNKEYVLKTKCNYDPKVATWY